MPKVLVLLRRRSVVAWFLLLVAVALVTWLVTERTGSRETSPFFLRSPERPLVVAYRGDSAGAPENTLPAFRRALLTGAEVLAMDVWPTSDGEWVVVAGPRLESTTEGAGLVDQLALQDLKALDAAYRFTPDEGRTFPFRGHGVTIPTLEEVFQALPGVRMMLIVHEAPPGAGQGLARLIRRWGRADQVALIAPDEDVWADLREALPETASSAGLSEARRFYVYHRLGLLPLRRGWSDFLVLPNPAHRRDLANEALLRDAHRRRLQVFAGPVDDRQDLREVAATRLDGILTRFPGELRAILDNTEDRSVTQLDDSPAGLGDFGVMSDDY